MPAAFGIELSLSNMAEPFLELVNITKTYPGVTALNDVSLSVAKGEVIGLIGENGAGKSTLMKILGGVAVPTSGHLRVDGAGAAVAQRVGRDRRRHRLRAPGTQPVREPRCRGQRLHRPRAARAGRSA